MLTLWSGLSGHQPPTPPIHRTLPPAQNIPQWVETWTGITHFSTRRCLCQVIAGRKKGKQINTSPLGPTGNLYQGWNMRSISPLDSLTVAEVIDWMHALCCPPHPTPTPTFCPTNETHFRPQASERGRGSRGNVLMVTTNYRQVRQ